MIMLFELSRNWVIRPLRVLCVEVALKYRFAFDHFVGGIRQI